MSSNTRSGCSVRAMTQRLGAAARFLHGEVVQFENAGYRVAAAFVIVDVEDGGSGVGWHMQVSVPVANGISNPFAPIGLRKHFFREHGSSLGIEYITFLTGQHFRGNDDHRNVARGRVGLQLRAALRIRSSPACAGPAGSRAGSRLRASSMPVGPSGASTSATPGPRD